MHCPLSLSFHFFVTVFFINYFSPCLCSLYVFLFLCDMFFFFFTSRMVKRFSCVFFFIYFIVFYCYVCAREKQCIIRVAIQRSDKQACECGYFKGVKCLLQVTSDRLVVQAALISRYKETA